MKGILLRGVCVLALGLSACASVPPTPVENARHIVEAKGAIFSSAVTKASAAAWAPEEVEALVALYIPDATLFPPDRPVLKGRDAIRQYWTRTSSNRILAHAVTVEHAEYSGNLLFEYGSFTMTYQKDGATPKEGKARYVSVWRRDAGGEWRKHLDTWW